MPESKKLRTAVVKIYGMPLKENISKAKNAEAKGQFVTPQKSAVIPIAAPKSAGSPKSNAAAPPKVAPINKVGTISPPLKPAATQMQVKRIFKAKA